ncbi:hypothetical protein ACLOJK_041830, partial [Asimina triloba]
RLRRKFLEVVAVVAKPKWDREEASMRAQQDLVKALIVKEAEEATKAECVELRLKLIVVKGKRERLKSMLLISQRNASFALDVGQARALAVEEWVWSSRVRVSDKRFDV